MKQAKFTLQLAVYLVCVLSSLSLQAVEKRPNVLLILCDDIRWNALYKPDPDPYGVGAFLDQKQTGGDWESTHEALGVSSLMLKDPAAKRMITRAEKLGVAGKYIAFTKEVVKAAQNAFDEPVDLDMLGATGATMLDLGFTPEATWAILAVTRAFATGAHYIEEVEREEPSRTGQNLTPKEFYDGPEDRPVPPLKDRDKVAESGICRTVDEWAAAREERKKIIGSGHSIVEEIEDPSKKSGIKKVVINSYPRAFKKVSASSCRSTCRIVSSLLMK